MDDFEDDQPEENGFYSEEPLIRDNEIGDLYLMKLVSGETIIGTVINETSEFIELSFPMVYTNVLKQIDEKVYPAVVLYRFIPGLSNDYVTVSKDRIVFYNYPDDTIVDYYFKVLPDTYPILKKMQSAAAMYDEFVEYVKNEEEKLRLIEDDPEVEREVMKRVLENPATSVTDIIASTTGHKPTTH